MKIRILAFLMVLVLTLGMLVACKPDEGTDDPVKGEGGGGDEVIVEDTHYDSIYWDEDTFIFKLSENSNQQELPSTCARYLAGDTDIGLLEGEFPDDIDDMVDVRNDDATKVTKINPTYVYIEDDGAIHGWGQNINDMVYDSANFVAGYTPDAYVNFVYDMLCASLSGAFANLKTSSVATDGKKSNYFRFVDPKFKDTGENYMVEYMRSLSLSRNKQYCLSSDYFTDMVRAFFVVPVNVNLLESIPASTTEGVFNYDYDGDGLYELEDFYEYVYEGKWSYATLAEISASNFFQESGVDAESDDPNGDLHDRLIFAIGESSGLSSSGMLYTTSVTIIARELVELEGPDGTKYNDYVYTYPTDNPDLYAFCDALTSLMSENKGVISITNNQTEGYYSGNALLAIRNRFTNNRILFGGDICLGSLEYLEYREMDDGFGVVPVPLFRTVDEDGAPERYMTQIHNVGRIGAINAKTLKFGKISAYLDYQSMNSTEILEEYYTFKLSHDVAGGGDNKEMLNYIRSNVRTSFDKAFEDAIGRLFANADNGAQGEGTSSEKQKWHALIKEGHFEVDAGAMAELYNSYIGSKGERLDSLEASYVGLPE